VSLQFEGELGRASSASAHRQFSACLTVQIPFRTPGRSVVRPESTVGLEKLASVGSCSGQTQALAPGGSSRTGRERRLMPPGRPCRSPRAGGAAGVVLLPVTLNFLHLLPGLGALHLHSFGASAERALEDFTLTSLAQPREPPQAGCYRSRNVIPPGEGERHDLRSSVLGRTRSLREEQPPGKEEMRR
jgi:hypothetical protein